MTNEDIRILKVAIENSKEHISFCFDSRGIAALQLAIKVLSQTSWIPVSERLPEEDGEYLVSIEGNITHKMIVDIAHWYKSEKANNGFYKANEVFAWMPLPESYKEDNNGE